MNPFRLLIVLSLLFGFALPAQAQIVVRAFLATPFDSRFDTMKTVAKAFQMYNSGKHKQSIPLFDAAIKQYKNELALYQMRGLAKHFSGDSKAAMKDIEIAISMEKEYSSVNVMNYAYLATYAGDIPTALKTFDHLIAKTDSSEKELLSEAYAGRGQAKAIKGNYKSAIEDYQLYFNNQTSTDINVVMLWAWANWFDNNYLEAINACDTLLTPVAINEIGEDAANNIRGIRGACRFYQKDYVGSIADFVAIAKLSDVGVVGDNGVPIILLPNEERNRCLAHSYLMTNNYTKAEKIYKAEIKKSPTFAAALRTDLQKFKEYGITHPDLAKVEVLLSTK